LSFDFVIRGLDFANAARHHFTLAFNFVISDVSLSVAPILHGIIAVNPSSLLFMAAMRPLFTSSTSIGYP
jgi:hypothetical protein